LSSTSTSLGKSSAAQSNRYIETKQLIQLNADTIQMNARLIEANAEEIRLTASKTDETSGRLMEAELVLYGDDTGAHAGLIARMGENEASILLHADELGTLAEIKADKVDLGKYATVSRLEAEIADVKITESSYVTTAGLNTQSLGANYVETNTFSIGGTMLTLKSTDYVKSVGRTKRYALSPSNISIEFWEISSISNGTLYYLGYAG